MCQARFLTGLAFWFKVVKSVYFFDTRVGAVLAHEEQVYH